MRQTAITTARPASAHARAAEAQGARAVHGFSSHSWARAHGLRQTLDQPRHEHRAAVA